MACNCATKQQIEELHKKFGFKVTPTEGQKMSFKIRKGAVNVGVGICVILLTPVIAGYLLYKAFFTDGRINVPKIMGLKAISETNVG